MGLPSTCSSSSFGHPANLPKSEASSLSAPSTAFREGVMLQIKFQTLPASNQPLQLPPLCTHSLVSTSGASVRNCCSVGRVQVVNPKFMVDIPM